MRSFSAAAAPGTEATVNSYLTGNQIAADIACAPSDSFIVAWRGATEAGPNDGVQGQRFDGNGPLGGEFQVNTYTTGSVGFRDSPKVASDDAGDFVVTWSKSGSGGLAFRRFLSTGTAEDTTQVDFSSGSFLTYTVAIDRSNADGDFVVVWNDYTGDRQAGRRFLDPAAS